MLFGDNPKHYQCDVETLIYFQGINMRTTLLFLFGTLICFFINIPISSADENNSATIAQSSSPDSPFRKASHFIFLSGVPGGSIHVDDPRAEVKEILDNLKSATIAAGGDVNDIVKVTVYMVDATDDYPILNEMTPDYFKKPYPARSPVGVASLPGGKRIEIDAVMFIKSSKNKIS